MDSSKVINELLVMMRHSGDVAPVLAHACEALTQGLNASRCVLWTIVGDQLLATEEFSHGADCFKGNMLNSQESMSIVLEFLSRFPDESGGGLVYVHNTARDTDLHKFSPTLASLLELGDVRSRLIAQLRSRGIFSGFVEIQKCGTTTDWSEEDWLAFEQVALVVSLLEQQRFDSSRIASGTRDLEAIREIGCVFTDSKDSKTAWKNAAALTAAHLGFKHCQIFLFEKIEDADALVPQTDDALNTTIKLTEPDNPVVEAYFSSGAKIHNLGYSRRQPEIPFFGEETTLLFPFIADGLRLGVCAVWKRLPNVPSLTPQARDMGLTLAKIFALYAQRSSGAM
jgi:hypothetical protein